MTHPYCESHCVCYSDTCNVYDQHTDRCDLLAAYEQGVVDTIKAKELTSNVEENADAPS